MKKDTINQLFNQLEGEFNIEQPEVGHNTRFLEKLKQHNNPVVDSQSKKRTSWKPFMAVAASLVLCFTAFTVIQQQEPELMDLASVSPELSQTQSFFTTAIEQEIASLESQRSPETEDLIVDALRQLKVLEEGYEQLKINLTESGSDKRVIYAMINNFQNRIDILQTVIKHIEEVKNFKYNQNENTNTI